MTPKQITDLLVGMAEAQAAMLDAVSETFEKGPGLPALKQAAGNGLHLLQGGNKQKPITFETLPAKVLQAALVPNSLAGRTLRETTLAEVQKLLQASKP